MEGRITVVVVILFYLARVCFDIRMCIVSADKILVLLERGGALNDGERRRRRRKFASL